MERSADGLAPEPVWRFRRDTEPPESFSGLPVGLCTCAARLLGTKREQPTSEGDGAEGESTVATPWDFFFEPTSTAEEN